MRTLRFATRRSWISGAACASASLGVSGLVRAEDVPSEKKTEPKILIVGDSMITGGFGVFLERALKKEHGYPVRRMGKSSTGLARPDFFNWMKNAKSLIAEGQPDIVIVMFGGNDTQGLYMGKGKWIRWGEEEWWPEYARRIDELCTILAPDQQQIYWVGLPTMRPDKFRGRVEYVNTIFRAEMAIRRNAYFIDTWSVLADEDGAYADRIYLEPAAEGVKRVKVRVRAGDGIHISPEGSHHLKKYVLEVLLPEFEAFKPHA